MKVGKGTKRRDHPEEVDVNEVSPAINLHRELEREGLSTGSLVKLANGSSNVAGKQSSSSQPSLYSSRLYCAPLSGDTIVATNSWSIQHIYLQHWFIRTQLPPENEPARNELVTVSM